MLFDIKPKTRLKDLYDRREEFEEIRKGIEHGEPLIVVYGVRRIGKTSLVRATLNELQYPHTVVDVREIYEEYGYITRNRLYQQILGQLARSTEPLQRISLKIKDLTRNIRELSIPGLRIETQAPKETSITGLLRELDTWAERQDTRIVIALDEAQYLRFSGPTRWDGILAWAYDNLAHTTIIVTGSEAGILQDFLRANNPQAPLYGRYLREILLRKFTPEESKDFLQQGFRETNTPIEAWEVEEAVQKLDGIPGWLTLYGYYRTARRLGHREALETVFETGSALVAMEIEKIIAPSRKRYLAILEAITHGATRWREIKTYTEYRTGAPIADKNFTNLLKKLVKYGIIEKHGDMYEITDPLTRHAVRKLASKPATR